MVSLFAKLILRLFLAEERDSSLSRIYPLVQRGGPTSSSPVPLYLHKGHQGVNGMLAVKRQRGVEPAGRGKPRMLALDGSSAGWFGWLG